MLTFPIILLASALLVFVYATVEFTNVICTPIDKEFCGYEYCFLKSVNRSYKYMSVKVNLYKVPITNVSIHMNFMKKANGYKPFLYNMTFDTCKFLASTKKNPLIQFFHNFFVDYSNMNHTCPFNNDLIVEKLPVSHINNMLTNMLPVPAGEYALFTTWIAYNKPRSTFNVYLKIF